MISITYDAKSDDPTDAPRVSVTCVPAPLRVCRARKSPGTSFAE